MDIKLRRRKAAEAASLSRMGTAILKGNRLALEWLPDNAPEIGYTAMGKPTTVHVLWRNDEFMKDMDDSHQALFRMGVFAHELLHQCFTAFSYSNAIANSLSRAQAAIFMNFANTLEDPAIEYFAPTVFGGRLLEALRYSIRTIYALSEGIDKSKTAFSQLINALVQFGDMGIIKGKFTFPEARKYFDLVAPIYNKGITCPNAKKRIDIARECMELTRPLWEEEVKNEEEFRKLLEKLAESLKMKGSPKFSPDKPEGASEGKGGDGGAKEGKDEKESRREEILKKIAEAAKKAEKESEESSDGADGKESGSGTAEGEETGEAKEITSDMSGSSTASDEGTDKKASTKDKEGSSDEALKDSKSESFGTEIESTAGSSKKDSEETSSESKTSSATSGELPVGESSKEDATVPDKDTKAADITKDEDIANAEAESYVIDDAVLDEVEKSIESEEKAIRKKESEDGAEENEMEIPDFDIDVTEAGKKKCTCINRRVEVCLPRERLSDLYRQMTSEYAWDIRNLTKSLDKIFEADKEEEHRSTSGTYNIKRGSIGTSAKIFDKRRDPGNRKDVAVCLCIDQSGSMHSEHRMDHARKTAIVLAEALTKLKIPYYVMGFTADIGASAVHNHFVDWKNRKIDRESLVGMQAGGNNFDGYSIRYCAELLKTRRENNKILFVISDGEPACNSYRSFHAGISDTTTAIKDARKSSTVFGIAIGTGCNQSTLQGMYGADFIAVSDSSLLTNVFAKKLAKTIK